MLNVLLLLHYNILALRRGGGGFPIFRKAFYDPTKKSFARGEFELASYNDLVGSISSVNV